MAIIGCIVVLLFGVYLIAGTVVRMFVGYAFCGIIRFSDVILSAVVVTIGAILIYYGWVNMPFHIVMN